MFGLDVRVTSGLSKNYCRNSVISVCPEGILPVRVSAKHSHEGFNHTLWE